ncbi:MAG TPA: DegV family protein [Anaerolineales bacterium]|nr:DegV family protein [Anaerolineales bacterium]
MLRIVTDGAADVPTAWEKEYDIRIIPINIHFGEKTFVQFEEMGFDDFYREIESNKNHPKTSQPSPHQFVEFYKKNFKPGDTILSMHVTSKLSGTYASAVSAAQELKDTFKIVTFDSLGGSAGLAFMCRSARQMERAGKSVEEIVGYLETVRPRTQLIITMDTLEYARRSGRVGTLQTALASALNVKPIARIEDGILDMVDKVRTRKAAMARVIEFGKQAMGNGPVHIAVAHARDPQAGNALLEEAKKSFNARDTIMTDFSVSLVIQFGPGSLALVLYPAE